MSRKQMARERQWSNTAHPHENLRFYRASALHICAERGIAFLSIRPPVCLTRPGVVLK